MASDILELQNQLQQALLSIEKVFNKSGGYKIDNNGFLSADFVGESKSLLQRCDEVCDQYEDDKPTIRIIHHLACSGGSLVSKCISALPNVFLLSEVHPHSYQHLPKGKPRFLPSDIANLASQAGFPEAKLLAKAIFKNAINETLKHIDERGGCLVLRDHSHSDVCVGKDMEERSIVAEYLKEDYNIVRLVTLRNPIDSYAALASNQWVHFEPQAFDEYCRRILIFLAQFEKSQIFMYEDFVLNPQEALKHIAAHLDIPFDDSFELLFDAFSVTGDSGRKGQIISPRTRRPLGEELIGEIESSAFFGKLCEMYNLNPAI